MEVKVDGDGWGWKQSLRGRVGMGVISVPVQVSAVQSYTDCSTVVALPTQNNCCQNVNPKASFPNPA